MNSNYNSLVNTALAKEDRVADSMQERIVVAMSGGVDSSVAALLLRQQGYDAIGISMQVWDYRNEGSSCSKATCCAPADFNDARRVAASINMPYYVFDFEDIFREEVIDTFVDSYQQGLTPNPCVDCNNKIKFKELRRRAASLGYDTVATGHFARIEKRRDGFHLLRGRDSLKDQSYFLYGLTQAELSRTLFPVGELTKQEVREIASTNNLNTAEKAESQDICFVSGKVSDFIVKLGAKRKEGNLVDMRGKVLGKHDGVHNFTVGQRKGLNLGGNTEPLYVIRTDPSANSVVVGSKADLERSHFRVGNLSFCSPSLIDSTGTMRQNSFSCIAQLRYRHVGVKVEVSVSSEGQPDGDYSSKDYSTGYFCDVKFAEDWTPVSPGQACVFYSLDNQEVLGGGRILRD